MKITNKKDLPQGILDAVKNDYYTKGNAKFSVTGLLQPPQQARLFKIFNNEVTIDASDEIWKLFGSAVHHILDRGQGKTNAQSEAEVRLANVSLTINNWITEHQGILGDYYELYNRILDELNNPIQTEANTKKVIYEERLYLNVGDVRISGQMDWYNLEEKKVEDYKVTTVYKVTKGDHDDWEAQLNVYALLLINAGYPVEKLQINAILKDWKGAEFVKAQKSEAYYSDCGVEKVDITLWKPMDTLKWIIARIEDHMQVDELNESEEIALVRPCTDEEKWQGKTTYALMKKGGKRASAVFDTEQEANAACFAKDSEYYVETRLGYAIRCKEYCSVKDFCFQYKRDHTNEVTYEVMKVEALKNLEELIPEKEEIEEIVDEKEKDTSNEDFGILEDSEEELPTIPEEIKPKEDVDFSSLQSLMDNL